jgi:hypothetical protein
VQRETFPNPFLVSENVGQIHVISRVSLWYLLVFVTDITMFMSICTVKFLVRPFSSPVILKLLIPLARLKSRTFMSGKRGKNRYSKTPVMISTRAVIDKEIMRGRLRAGIQQ